MRAPGVVLVIGGLVAASCALPDVVYDPAAGTGGAGATGGDAGTGGAGTGGGAGTEGDAGMGGDTGTGGAGTGGAGTGGKGGGGGSGGTGGKGGAGGTGGKGGAGTGGVGTGGVGTGGAGTGGAGTGGAGTGGAGGTTTCVATTEREDLCGQYCTTYLAECSTHQANTYEDVLDCALTCACAPWPIGTITERGSVECRRYHSTLAASSGVDPHCYHASEFPTMGACECPTTTERDVSCAEYCSVYLAECSMHEANTYENEADCLHTCTCAPWPIGTITEPGSLECRRYHSTLAASSGVNPHCYHSAEFPTMGACECPTTAERDVSCAEYCSVYLAECSVHEANTYENEADCLHTCTCAPWPLGTITEPGSLECRRYHATLAASSGVDPHCYHSAEFPTMGACEVVSSP